MSPGENLIPDYIIQKAVNADKVIKKNKKTLAEYSETCIAQRKYDGCCAVIKAVYGLEDDQALAGYSRTDEFYPSLTAIAQELEAEFRLGFVFIGEAWVSGWNFSRISGEFRRLEPSENLRFIINDVLTAEEFAAGYSSIPYTDRMERLPRGKDGQHWGRVASWAPGTYGCPQALCDKLVAEGGYDGLILRDPNGTWTKGSGTTGEIVKIKRVLSYDLRVTEVNTAVGGKTGRTVYKLVVDFQGKPLGVGSGVPHNLADVPKVGDIVEVEAMDLSSEGLLREPRFKGIRHDKPAPDC